MAYDHSVHPSTVRIVFEIAMRGGLVIKDVAMVKASLEW